MSVKCYTQTLSKIQHGAGRPRKDLAKQDFRRIFKEKKHLEENQEEVMKTNQKYFPSLLSLSFFSLKLHEGLRRKQTLEASSRCLALRRKVRRSSRRPTSLLFSKSFSLLFLLLFILDFVVAKVYPRLARVIYKSSSLKNHLVHMIQ